jgi:hypothetical protein
MRFTVGTFTPAAPGQTGVMKASRARTRGSDEQQRITVKIDCRPAGVSFGASEDGAWLGQTEFQRAFHHAFLGVQSTRAAQAELDAQIVAGTAPASQQRRDLRVVVQPLRGQASKLDFPFDLDAAGVLPVRVDVTNLTPRTYTLATAEIRLTSAQRERVAALSPAEAAQRVAAAKDGTASATTLSAASIAELLAHSGFTASEIPPGARREGYLYFPKAQYVSARIVFTDRESGEAEGVRVEF